MIGPICLDLLSLEDWVNKFKFSEPLRWGLYV